MSVNGGIQAIRGRGFALLVRSKTAGLGVDGKSLVSARFRSELQCTALNSYPAGFDAAAVWRSPVICGHAPWLRAANKQLGPAGPN